MNSLGYIPRTVYVAGVNDMGELWRSPYEMPDFEATCERLWQQVRPLYEQLHTYVRRQLLRLYGHHGHMFPESGHIPAHLLGNKNHNTLPFIVFRRRCYL